MKTKNKMLALVEIAIVLCSLLLVALPTIAAEDDFVLGIYGNANEDDTIDMRDLTYVKLIFFGEKPETELADAKYDGEIDPLDFVQIKLMTVGKEKELTVVDLNDRIVTVKKPIERVVASFSYTCEAIRTLRAQDKVVGIDSYTKEKSKDYFPELSKLPGVGLPLDYEAILNLNPDLVVGGIKYPEKLPGIPTVCLHLWVSEDIGEALLKLGYILDKQDEAKHYILEFHDKYIDQIKARTEGLSEEERPKVYVEDYRRPYRAYSGKSAAQGFIEMCGGRNIFADIEESKVIVDPEEVMMRNPDIIIRYISVSDAGYEYDEPSKIKASWEDTVNRTELANVNAVKNNRVYIIDNDLNYGLDYPIALAYWAKWFHPDLFEDIDPQAIHQEFLTEFYGLDYNVYEHGIFVYHPEEHPDGK
jgi:iron complex transport system substrate-binding protein